MNLFIYPVLLSWMNKELLPNCAQPWGADRGGRGGRERGRERGREGETERERERERERETGAPWSRKRGNATPWGMLRRVKWSLLWHSHAHAHKHTDTHALTYASVNKRAHTCTHTHTQTHTRARPPPPLPGVLIWHSIYTHIYTVYSLLYKADRYLSGTLLWGAQASRRCNQTVHSPRALSQCSFNNGLREMRQ